MGMSEQTLARLVDTHPSAAGVFHRRGLDFCCDGDRTLAAACEVAGLETDVVEREIELEDVRRREPFIAWHERPVRELIEHIVERYHRPLEGELARLMHLAAIVEERHADDDRRLATVGFHLGALRDTLLPHFDKEEEILFPQLLADPRRAARAIEAMRSDHHDADDHLRVLERNTDRFRPPPGADAPWRALLAGLENLDRELRAHLHLEHNTLVPRVLNELGPSGGAEGAT